MLQFARKLIHWPLLKPIEYVNVFQLGNWSLLLGASYFFDHSGAFDRSGLANVATVQVWFLVFLFIFSLSLIGSITSSLTIRRLVLCFSTFLWSLLVFEALTTNVVNDIALMPYVVLAILTICNYLGLDHGSK